MGRGLAGRVWRDEDLAAAFGQSATQLACVIGVVCDQHFRCWHPAQDIAQAYEIVRLATRQGTVP